MSRQLKFSQILFITYKCVFGIWVNGFSSAGSFFPDSWSESGMFCYSLVVIFQVLGTWCLWVCQQSHFSPFSL
jgi:hypothetical protein